MQKINRKAEDVSPGFYLIFGIIIFIIITFSGCNAILKATNSYKNSEKSLQSIIDVSKNMSDPASRVQLTLVNLKMEEGTSVYVFTSKDDLIEYLVSPTKGIGGGSMGSSDYIVKRVIKKPMECSNFNDCICLCKDSSIKRPIEVDAKAIEAKYDVPSAYSNMPVYGKVSAFEIVCGKEIECYSIDNLPATKIFQETTELAKIVSKSDYDRIKDNVPRFWEGGFSFSRISNYGEQIIRTPYTDLYVIKNSDGTIGYCFDNNVCAQIP